MLTKAENRAIGLEEIDPPLNFGPNNSLATLKTSISKTKKLLESYSFIQGMISCGLLVKMRYARSKTI